MKLKNLIILLLLYSITGFGQSADKDCNCCLDGIELEPAFIALSTNKNSSLHRWYQETFNLKVVKEFSFADGSGNGIIMKSGEFVVEVMYHNNILNPDTVAQSDSQQCKGILKFGIYTNANLLELKQCLVEKHYNVGRIFSDEELGINLLQIVDPEGNSMEIISRKAGKDKL